MLYFSLDRNTIRFLLLKKSVMGQYETFFFDKQYQTELLKSGNVISTDLIASAVKEALNSSKGGLKDKDVYLILPQECFLFLRTTIPTDIAPSALRSFINDKARSEWQTSLDEFFYDYLIQQTDKQSIVNLFAIKKEVFAQYQEAFTLIDYRIINILPETLAYFKLFEKTLRKEKQEKILFATFENNKLSGYLYDSGGLISPTKWQVTIPQETEVEKVLKEQIAAFEKNGQKLSRLILSGQSSENIRQDTFTKTIGLWTNPLKRIISGFYQDYLKQFVPTNNQSFSILKYDVCFGAFIFSTENKQFSLLKKFSGFNVWPTKKISLPKLKIPVKETILFIVSFVLSFLLFIFVSKLKIDLSFFNALTKNTSLIKPVSPTATPIPSPTPTPAFKKESLKIKILNGSGIKGRALEVKDVLKDKGYGEILTDNADNFDYEKTVLQVKKSRQEAIVWIKDDLKNNLSSLKTSFLDDDQAADVILIIGKDFE